MISTATTPEPAGITYCRPVHDAQVRLGVMNPAEDNDAEARVVRIVIAPGHAGRPSPPPPPAPPGASPAAQRARRYRARQRGEDVPLLKPGPAPVSRDAWRERALAAELALRRAEARIASLEAIPAGQRRRRQHRQGLLAGAARELARQLGLVDGRQDAPAVRELLRDVAAAIDARHDLWPES